MGTTTQLRLESCSEDDGPAFDIFGDPPSVETQMKEATHCWSGTSNETTQLIPKIMVDPPSEEIQAHDIVGCGRRTSGGPKLAARLRQIEKALWVVAIILFGLLLLQFSVLIYVQLWIALLRFVEGKAV